MRPRASIAEIGLTRRMRPTACEAPWSWPSSSGCRPGVPPFDGTTRGRPNRCSPEKLAHLQTLTPRRLVPHRRADQLYYAYADPEVCRCLYTGTETQYQAYQQLALQQRRADEALMAAQANLNASMDWEMWGPWPWY